MLQPARFDSEPYAWHMVSLQTHYEGPGWEGSTFLAAQLAATSHSNAPLTRAGKQPLLCNPHSHAPPPRAEECSPHTLASSCALRKRPSRCPFSRFHTQTVPPSSAVTTTWNRLLYRQQSTCRWPRDTSQLCPEGKHARPGREGLQATGKQSHNHRGDRPAPQGRQTATAEETIHHHRGD